MDPCDPTALALFRIAFGLLMMLDIPLERGLEDADIRFGDQNYCFFPLFPWVKPVPVAFACLLYSAMWIGALGICLGYRFKQSCILYLIPYVYFFILDKSRWNNHSYLFMLFAILLKVGGAGERLNLGKHWVFGGLKPFLDQQHIEFYFIHMGGLCYDLGVGFLLNFQRTRKLGILISILFHGMNAAIFDIGMFPYICLASLILFRNADEWPCSWFRSGRSETLKPISSTPKNNVMKKSTRFLIFIYVGVQIFLPFSHSITKGFNNWTPGLYGYSWDMMVNSWETLHQKIIVKDEITGQEKFLDPDVWVANDRWSSHADMALQHAQCIARNLERYNISSIGVYFDIWKSLNGRFQQRIYDPRVNLLKVHWSPFTPVSFILPLLTQYSHYRDYFSTFFDINATSDVIFVADYPGLFLENFLPEELVNVTITLITGGIVFEENGINSSLSVSGEEHPVKSGKFHKVYSTHESPSCYMYRYTNGTEQQSMYGDESLEIDTLSEIQANFVKFMASKVEIFSRSVYLVANSYLNVLFDVPMVLRRRE
ncbi:Vitamin K-dependent gamma-carboxylase [Folsomia candida]|uniref:Vitamin K-dependent gamma-carboxylase n=1 Tax=Folsomia candida TaxID=158441 RepID=A0A226F3C9_FOLCA|nr:Vitamin K-dependent gamma-carboxylase [Folsomia candida]